MPLCWVWLAIGCLGLLPQSAYAQQGQPVDAFDSFQAVAVWASWGEADNFKNMERIFVRGLIVQDPAARYFNAEVAQFEAWLNDWGRSSIAFDDSTFAQALEALLVSGQQYKAFLLGQPGSEAQRRMLWRRYTTHDMEHFTNTIEVFNTQVSPLLFEGGQLYEASDARAPYWQGALAFREARRQLLMLDWAIAATVASAQEGQPTAEWHRKFQEALGASGAALAKLRFATLPPGGSEAADKLYEQFLDYMAAAKHLMGGYNLQYGPFSEDKYATLRDEYISELMPEWSALWAQYQATQYFIRGEE